jgi:hypothetical protein
VTEKALREKVFFLKEIKKKERRKKRGGWG